MSLVESASLSDGETENRKPRIAIMGEFSAGKSTLSNLLLGASPLPVKVTATQLPPVWMAFGEQEPFREDLEGNSHPVDLDNLQAIPLSETSVVRIFLQAELLENCDLIDMPGISDPNMAPEVWERVIHNADGVLWCTHATQAWRQSEAAVWKGLQGDLVDKSFLLITRIDKILNDRDRQKILKRVGRETEGLFAKTFPISLTQAMAAQDDVEKWQQSGAEDFSQNLVELLEGVAGTLDGRRRPLLRKPPETNTAEPGHKVFHLDDSAPEPAPQPIGIRPSRVRVLSASLSTTPRPGRPARPMVSTRI